MAQVNAWRSQDWATPYPDGSNQWMQLEDEQSSCSAAASSSGASYGGDGSAVSTSGGYGSWMSETPAMQPVVVSYTVTYNADNEPIYTPVYAAPQPEPVPAPAQPNYIVVSYTEYGDPVFATVYEAPSPVLVAAPMPAVQPTNPISYDQGYMSTPEVATVVSTTTPVVVTAQTVVQVSQTYLGESNTQTSAANYESATPVTVAIAASTSALGEQTGSQTGRTGGPMTSQVSTAVTTALVEPFVPVVPQTESGGSVAEASQSSAHGTRRRAQDFDGGFGAGSYDYGGYDYDFGSGGIDDGGLNDWDSWNSGGTDLTGGSNQDLFQVNFIDTSSYGIDQFIGSPYGTSTDPYGLTTQTGIGTNLGGIGGAPDYGIGTGSVGTSFNDTAANGDQPFGVQTNISPDEYGPFLTATAGGDGSDVEDSAVGSHQTETSSGTQAAGANDDDVQQVVVTGSRTTTTTGSESESSSIYSSKYLPVSGVRGVIPVGAEADYFLARDLDPLPAIYSPTLLDGRAGAGVAYRDLAGQVFYKTFDANGDFVGWISPPVQLAAALVSAGPSSIATKAASLAGDILALEMALGGPQFKAAAEATVYIAAGLAGWWWMTQNSALLLSSASLTPEQLLLVQNPMINVPVSPGSDNTTSYPVSTNGQVIPGVPSTEAMGPAYSGTTTTPTTEPTWADSIIDKSDSQALGENLRAAGIVPPGNGYEAHHIVPSRAGGTDMQPVRDKLISLGIKLNDAENGVWLPGPNASADAEEAYHRTLNNADYFRAVIAAFEPVTTLDQAKAVLKDIGSQLQNADFDGVRDRP